jgi:hypothetical protein
MRKQTMAYNRHLEDRTRLTVNGKQIRVGNPDHPYHEMYKQRGLQAVIKAMGLIDEKVVEVQEPEHFPWISTVFGIAILWAVVCFTFFGE